MTGAETRVVADLRIVEFVDGHQTNECKLRQEGGQSYLDVARRAIEALGGQPIEHTTTSISDVLHELTDLVERAHVPDAQMRSALDAIETIREGWPYNDLVRRVSDATGEPVDAEI